MQWSGDWTDLWKRVKDETAPTVTGSPDSSPNAKGWYKTNVTINWSSVDPDPSSGTPTDPPDTIASTEDANVTYTSASSCDPSGNCAIGSLTLSIDKTAPTISATITPSPNSDGWNNSDVTVSFSCFDSLSGISSCPGSTSLTSEGSGQSVSGTATDNAGNTASTMVTINIDKTDPTVGTPVFTKNPKRSSETSIVTADAGDSLSGVVGGEYFIDTDPGEGNGTPMASVFGAAISGVIGTNVPFGVHEVGVRSKDAAGNWSTVSVARLVVLPI